MSILDRIQEPNDIKKIDEKDLPELAQDIREFLIANVSVKPWVRGTYDRTSPCDGFPG